MPEVAARQVTDLVSVLDLDNAAVFPQSEDRAIRTPTRVRPTTLIISLNDVNAIRRSLRPTGRDSANRCPIKSANGGA